MDPMLAHFESFPLKQDMDAAVAVSDATLREITNPLAKNDRIFTSRPTTTTCASQRQDAACSTFADLEAVLYEGDERALLSDLHSFFSMTSCNIALSRERSATSFLSRRVSSSSNRSLRSSDGPRPPNFRFQRRRGPGVENAEPLFPIAMHSLHVGIAEQRGQPYPQVLVSEYGKRFPALLMRMMVLKPDFTGLS